MSCYLFYYNRSYWNNKKLLLRDFFGSCVSDGQFQSWLYCEIFSCWDFFCGKCRWCESTPAAICCWCTHLFSGKWCLQRNMKRKSSLSKLGNQSYLPQWPMTGKLRETLTCAQQCVWEGGRQTEATGSRSNGKPAPFNKHHLQGNERERNITNGTWVISYWADSTIMQCRNIWHYRGSRAKMHRSEFCILNIIP